MCIPLGTTVMVHAPNSKLRIAHVTADMGDKLMVGRAHHGGFVSAIVPASAVVPVHAALNALRRAADAGRLHGRVEPIPIAYGDAILAYVRDLEDRLGIEQSPWAGEGEE